MSVLSADTAIHNRTKYILQCLLALLAGTENGDKMIRRDTKQRHLVLNAVRARCDHPTADQIYDDVHKLNARISRGTVYRNLNFLCEEGAICHVRVPGADRYDLRTDLHYHMFCIICKKVIDAPYPYKTFLDDEIAKKTGYKISRHRLIFEGICPTCQSNEIHPLTEPVFVRPPAQQIPLRPVPAFTEKKKSSRKK